MHRRICPPCSWSSSSTTVAVARHRIVARSKTLKQRSLSNDEDSSVSVFLYWCRACGFLSMGRIRNCCSSKPQLRWHVASFGSKTMAEFERQSLPITSSARSCAPKRVASTGLFFGANAACSIAPHHLEHLQCDQPDWPNFDAKGFKTAAIMWQLLEAPAATVQKPICKSFHHFKVGPQL